MPRKTKAQCILEERFGGKMPPQPRRVTARNYQMMVDHLIRNQTYEDISYPHRLERERIRQIVEKGLEWAQQEQQPPAP